MCVEASKKSEHILTLKIGRLSRNREEACNKHLFFDEEYSKTTTIISKFALLSPMQIQIGVISLLLFTLKPFWRSNFAFNCLTNLSLQQSTENNGCNDINETETKECLEYLITTNCWIPMVIRTHFAEIY